MRPQLALIIQIFRQDVLAAWRVSPGKTTPMWHAISSYPFETIAAGREAGWLELSEDNDAFDAVYSVTNSVTASVRLTERGQIVARQEHVRQRRQRELQRGATSEGAVEKR